MADFRTHVTFSSVLGCGYSLVGMGMGMPIETALVAGGLCGVSGMLPDVDSDSGVPRREAMGFAAAIVPMLMVERFKQMQLEHDQMILAAAVMYFFIRFTAAKMIGRWSVHRGMWHSIPAVLIFAGLAFLITGSDDIFVRYFKAAAVGLGAFSHLLLDEIYSVDTKGVIPRFKSSFGSAIKFWGKDGWANFSTYAKLGVVAIAILSEQSVMDRIQMRNPALADRLQGYGEHLQGYSDGFRVRLAPQQERQQGQHYQGQQPVQSYPNQPNGAANQQWQPGNNNAGGYQQNGFARPQNQAQYNQQLNQQNFQPSQNRQQQYQPQYRQPYQSQPYQQPNNQPRSYHPNGSTNDGSFAAQAPPPVAQPPGIRRQ